LKLGDDIIFEKSRETLSEIKAYGAKWLEQLDKELAKQKTGSLKGSRIQYRQREERGKDRVPPYHVVSLVEVGLDSSISTEFPPLRTPRVPGYHFVSMDDLAIRVGDTRRT
jgi:hypothetical protein